MELIRIYIERNMLWSTLRIIKSFICRSNPLPPDRPSFNIAFICKRHPLHRAIPKSTSAPPELQNYLNLWYHQKHTLIIVKIVIIFLQHTKTNKALYHFLHHEQCSTLTFCHRNSGLSSAHFTMKIHKFFTNIFLKPTFLMVQTYCIEADSSSHLTKIWEHFFISQHKRDYTIRFTGQMPYRTTKTWPVY